MAAVVSVTDALEDLKVVAVVGAGPMMEGSTMVVVASAGSG